MNPGTYRESAVNLGIHPGSKNPSWTRESIANLRTHGESRNLEIQPPLVLGKIVKPVQPLSDTAWLIKCPQCPRQNLKSGSSILFVCDLASHVCQTFMRADRSGNMEMCVIIVIQKHCLWEFEQWDPDIVVPFFFSFHDPSIQNEPIFRKGPLKWNPPQAVYPAGWD